MSKPVHIRDLSVNRMYGRAFRLSLEGLAPGVNIIWGPNGSGKSTVAHAIQTILLEDYQFAKEANVAATLQIGEDALRFNIDGPRRFCTRNGQQMEWDSAPKLIRPDSYHFSLHDLLSSVYQGGEFAAEIVRQGSGGFDLRKAQEALDFKSKRFVSTSVSRAYDKAQKALRAVEQSQERLLSQKDKCDQLEAQLEKAGQAAQEIELFQKALDWQTHHRVWQNARNAVEAFPEVIRGRAYLTGLVSGADELKANIASLREKERLQSDSLVQAEQKLAESPLHPNGLPEDVLETATARLAHLRELDGRIQRLREDLAGSRNQAANAWSDLGMSADGPDALTKRDIDRLFNFFERNSSLKGRRRAVEELRSVLDHDPDADFDEALARLLKTRDAVLDWLGTQRAPIPAGTSLLLWAALIGSAALSVVFGLTVAPWAYAGLVIPLLIIAALVRLQQPRTERVLPADDPQLAERLGNGEARIVLNELLGEQGKLTIGRENLNRWKATSTERRQIAADFQMLEEDMAKLSAETGLGAGDRTASEIYVLKRLLDWRESTDLVQKLEGQRNQKAAEFRAELASLNALLGNYLESQAADVKEAEVLASQLRRHSDKWKELSAAYVRRRSESDRIRHELSEAKSAYEDTFDRLDLEPDDMEGLRQCELQHKEYLKAQKALVESNAVLDQVRHAVESAPGYYEPVLERDDLEEALPQLQRIVDQREKLQKELTTIRLQIESAEAGRTLEEALANLDARRDELMRARDADAAKAVGRVLVQRLDAHIRSQQLPQVFERAQKIFLDITRGQYRLQFDLQGHFSALHTAENRNLNLDQLSSGTRVQLLLSVRMAFIQEQEQKQKLDYRLPVTLDETLGNSDDERARVVIKSLAHVSLERQVFYFTAQADEVAKWRQLSGEILVNEVALTDEVRSIPVDPDLLPKTFVVPDIRELTHRESGRKLQPARWSGHAEVSEIHPWYLMEDTTLLQRVLSKGVASWGAASALYASGLLDIPDYAQASTLARALRAWQDSWRVGRGKPVTSDALKASGAVTDRFFEAVLAKCEDCGFHGDDLLQALRNGQVRGFQTKKIEDLEEYLREHGYASGEYVKSPEQVYSDMLNAVADDLAQSGLTQEDVDRMLKRVETGPQAI